MKRKYILCSLIFLIYFFAQSQNSEKLCICFNQADKFIDVNLQDKDSTLTYFKIIREGFETEEQRKIVMEEYRKNLFNPEPNFYMTFIAGEKPKMISSFDEIYCANTISLKEYRRNGYKRPMGTKSDQFIFVQKINDKKFLKWEVIMEPVE